MAPAPLRTRAAEPALPALTPPGLQQCDLPILVAGKRSCRESSRPARHATGKGPDRGRAALMFCVPRRIITQLVLAWCSAFQPLAAMRVALAPSSPTSIHSGPPAHATFHPCACKQHPHVKVVEVLHQGRAAARRRVMALGALAAGHHVGARRACIRAGREGRGSSRPEIRKGRRRTGRGRVGCNRTLVQAVSVALHGAKIQRRGAPAAAAEGGGSGGAPASQWCSESSWVSTPAGAEP
jgi:hypothetical protein